MSKRLRAKYKVGNFVQFSFAGANFEGTIIEVNKTTTKIKYTVESTSGVKYPVDQEKIGTTYN